MNDQCKTVVMRRRGEREGEGGVGCLRERDVGIMSLKCKIEIKLCGLCWWWWWW